MSNCLICKNNLSLHYGDDILGEVFCKDCFDKYKCMHCNKMNIEVLFDKNNNVVDILIKPKYGSTVSPSSNLTCLFEPGYTFNLYCKECWETQDMYNEEDNESVEPEEDDAEFNNSDEEDFDEDNNMEDLYHMGKGKYDMY